MYYYNYKNHPFLVDLQCNHGENLKRLEFLDRGVVEYSSLVGFQFIPTPDKPWLGENIQLFYGQARFTQCRHIPWVIYHPTNREEAEQAVLMHGHAGSRVHPRTGDCAQPPALMWTTAKRKTRSKRNNIYPTFYRLRTRSLEEN